MNPHTSDQSITIKLGERDTISKGIALSYKMSLLL